MCAGCEMPGGISGSGAHGDLRAAASRSGWLPLEVELALQSEVGLAVTHYHGERPSTRLHCVTTLGLPSCSLLCVCFCKL